jgi:hypothetical protein
MAHAPPPAGKVLTRGGNRCCRCYRVVPVREGPKACLPIISFKRQARTPLRPQSDGSHESTRSPRHRDHRTPNMERSVGDRSRSRLRPARRRHIPCECRRVLLRGCRRRSSMPCSLRNDTFRLRRRSQGRRTPPDARRPRCTSGWPLRIEPPNGSGDHRKRGTR